MKSILKLRNSPLPTLCFAFSLAVLAGARAVAAQPVEPQTKTENPAAEQLAEKTPPSPPTRQLAVYTLSKGSGVPPSTLQASETVRSYLAAYFAEGKVVRLEQTVLGLEGETRLCVEFASVDAAQSALTQLTPLVRDAELINLRRENCIKD
jgi:hypothetical protein